MTCVSDKPDYPDKNNMAPVNNGFFSVGDTLTYTSNLDKLYCVNALKNALRKIHGFNIMALTFISLLPSFEESH